MAMPNDYVPVDPRGFWDSDAKIERLNALHAKAYPASEIAKALVIEFGGALTRSAVIGKLMRLRGYSLESGRKLRRDPKPPAAAIGFAAPSAPARFNGNLPPTKKKPPTLDGVVIVQVKAAQGIRAAKVLAFTPKTETKTRKGKTILDLGYNDCRFIVSGIGFEARYCAAPKRETVPNIEAPCPYCHHHWDMLRPKDIKKRSASELVRGLRRFI